MKGVLDLPLAVLLPVDLDLDPLLEPDFLPGPELLVLTRDDVLDPLLILRGPH